ncbi:MAG: chitobiase/beta-hexosaminidase C-terminal domain-containing protein [Spirochaetales bacterium]|nr:chitobiase/beta-hexosaminidase C-terminal domain-containing protein [Spirochaetales bacterium]
MKNLSGFLVLISFAIFIGCSGPDGDDETDAVIKPTFSPEPGTIYSATDISINCETPDAEIYYTHDGVDPSADSTPYTGPILIDDTTEIRAIAIKDGFADSEIATGIYDRQINTDSLHILDSISSSAYNVCIAGNYAYIARMSGGLGIIDVSDKLDLKISNTVSTAAWCYDVEIKDNYLYAGTGDGLMIYDVSDPENPVYVNTVTSMEILNIFISDNCAYLAADSNDLVIINIQNPTSAYMANQIFVEGLATDVFVTDEYAYVVTEEYQSAGSSFSIINKYGTPEVIKTIGISDGDCRSVTVNGDYAYVSVTLGAINRYGLIKIRISDPAEASIVDKFLSTCSTNDVYYAGDYLYVSWSNILSIYDYSTGSHIAGFTVGNYPRGIFVLDKYVYIASTGGGLIVMGE